MYIDKLNTGAPEGKRAGHYITFIFTCQVKFFEKNVQKKNRGFYTSVSVTYKQSAFDKANKIA